MPSTDQGFVSYVGPRQSGTSSAGLLNLPSQSQGTYATDRASTVSTTGLDSDIGPVQKALSPSSAVPTGLKIAVIHYRMTAVRTGTGLRELWENTTGDYTNSPGGSSAAYNSGTLTTLGSVTTTSTT